MTTNNEIQRSLSGWRVFLALSVAFAVVAYMLYSNITSIQYVPHDQGEYFWVDGNNNGVVDVHDAGDFSQINSNNPETRYRLLTFKQSFLELEWTPKAWWCMAFAALLIFGRDFFYILRIRILAAGDLTWRGGFFVILLWEFASALSPGVVGGAAVAMFILNREGISLGRATSFVVVTALMDNLFYLLMIPILLVSSVLINQWDIFATTPDELLWFFWVGYGLVVLVSVLLFLTLFYRPQIAKSFFSLVFSLPFIRRWKSNALKLGDDMILTSGEMRGKSWGFWFKVFGSTVGSWISRFLVINVLFEAFLELNLFNHIQVFAQQLVLWLLMLVSPTPGASGVAEYGFIELFANLAPSVFVLTIIILLWRTITYFPYLIIGIFLLPRWMRRKGV